MDHDQGRHQVLVHHLQVYLPRPGVLRQVFAHLCGPVPTSHGDHAQGHHQVLVRHQLCIYVFIVH